MTFKDKYVLITGTNRGIGLCCLQKFAEQGANILAHARKENPEFESMIATLSQKSIGQIKPIYFDLEKEAEIKTAIMQIKKEKTPVHILINNAGIAHGGLLSMTPMSKLKEVFEVNFFAQMLITQLISRIMIQQKNGCIVNIASVSGIESEAGSLAYGSSKAAFIWATKCISKELMPHNIRVNAIAPGYTKTDMGMYKSEEELEKTIQAISMKRMATPEEIVESILFLASDKASYITGHILSVDGGRS